MTRPHRPSRGLVLLLVLLSLPACRDDDVTAPLGGGDTWRQVPLQLELGNSQLLAVDFTGTRGVALGYGLREDKAVYEAVILVHGSGGWQPATPAGLPIIEFYLDVAVDADGALTAVGFDSRAERPSRLYDERGAIPQNLSRSGLGLLAVDGDGDFYVAGGASQGGALWTSTTPGTWLVDALPLSGQGESGFVDVCVRGETAVACGYDDGADVIPVLLRRTRDTAWEALPLPAGSGDVTLHSVALTDDGAIFVGGVEDAGGPDAQSWLAVRSAAGGWTRIVLPNAGLLGAVNDILVASDGSIYVACSGETGNDLATILRAGPGGVVRELTPIEADLLQLAEGPDGTLYAVGRQLLQNGIERALLLERPAD